MIASIIGGACTGFFIWFLLTPAPALTPEYFVARLPGVGAGWIDTLRRVAGPVAIDTVSALENFEEGGSDLIGLFESWHGLISIRAHMIYYSRYQHHYNSDVCRVFDYIHPVEIAGSPAGTLAHEFGHLFQFRARQHVVPQEGDTLPPWARDNINERYADRFARAMLALRGWVDASPYRDDVILYHRLRYLLIKSYWPTEVQAPPVVTTKRRVLPRSPVPTDGTSVFRLL